MLSHGCLLGPGAEQPPCQGRPLPGTNLGAGVGPRLRHVGSASSRAGDVRGTKVPKIRPGQPATEVLRHIFTFKENMAVDPFLSEFEIYVMSAIARLGDEAYGMTILREIEQR